MKKLLYLIMAAATLLFAAGCQQETGLSGDDGSLADVTFRVALDGMQTKAFSDGTKADSLVVMVYKDNNGFEYLPNVEPQEKPEFDANLTAEVNLKLVRGETYRIVFWAMHNDPSLYIFDKENAAVTVNVDGLVSNDDERDAFYGVWEGAIGRDGVEDGDVNLYRPFAQLNVLTSAADWEAAINNGVIFAGSSMSVKAPTKLNFFDGSVDEPAVYEFAQADIDQDVNIPGYEDYKYIAMNYILTDEGSNVGETNDPLKIEVYRESGLLADFDLVNVPVRRNYRTILVGDIFCADAIFQVTIQNEFGGNETVPLENAENQVITFDPDSAPGQDPGFEYDEDALTGAYTMTVGETLDFAGAFSSNSTFEPIYTSSDEEVGKFAAEVGDAPTLFTALAAGQTVVNLHFNAVINGEEMKSEIKNFKSADVNITITVVDGAEGYTVTIDQDIIDQEEEVGGVWIVDGDDEYESQFQAGATVNLIYDPIGDYDLTALWYLDENEEPVDIDFADGEASFIMPEYDVIIFATFEEAGDAVYALYDGAVVEGDYVIVYDDYAMNNETINDRLQYENVTIENNAIVNPVASIIWHIAPNGNNWTLYSADAQKYAASTGAKNKAVVIDDGTADKAQWTITKKSGNPVTYEIENVYNKGNSVNYTLRNNGTNGFACYATGTGGPLSLYKFVSDEPQPQTDQYAITINPTNFGEVTSDKTQAAENVIVTLTLTPGEECHYVANSLSITSETYPNGIEYGIEESLAAAGVYIATFTMPAEDVTVSADFEEDAEPEGSYTIYLNNKLGLNNGDVFESATDANQMVMVAGSIGTGSNGPKYYTDGDAVRFYGNNTITVSSNLTITQIEFTFGSNDGTKTISADKGEFAEGVWTGEATEVVFTLASGSGQRRIAKLTVYAEEPGGGDVPVAAGITLDGDLSDWEDIEGEEQGSFKDFKFAADSDSLYFYVKIKRSKIIAAKAEPYIFNWRRYIAIQIDTDNNPETGSSDASFAGITLPGTEAWGNIYPFRGTASEANGTDNLEIVNGEDSQGGIGLVEEGGPDGLTNKMKAFGQVEDDYVYLEFGFAKSAIGSPEAQTGKVQLSLAWDLTDQIEIPLN